MAETGEKVFLAERDAIRDIYGSCTVSTFEEAESMLVEARQEVDKLLQSSSNRKSKASYLEAMKKVPLLVERESNPDFFLRACNYNAEAAAKRLAGYWTKRTELFGERAFLPMTQCGRGTLTEADIAALKTGWIAMLPLDESGRVVIMTDRSKLTVEMINTDGVRERTMFYLLNMAFEIESAQRNGVVGIIFLNSTEDKVRKGPISGPIMQMFSNEITPLNTKAVHIITLQKKRLLEREVPNWLAYLERGPFLRQRTVVHFATSSEALGSDLEQYGLQKVPLAMGGPLHYESYLEEWHKKQLEVSTARSKEFFENKKAEDGLAQLAAAADQARQEGRKKRKRELDAVYQKKKREAEKKNYTDLTRNLQSLQVANKDLNEENERLDSLWKEALALVKEFERREIEQYAARPKRAKRPQAPAVPAAPVAGVPAASPTPTSAPTSDLDLLKQILRVSQETSGRPIGNPSSASPQQGFAVSHTLEYLAAMQSLEMDVSALEEKRRKSSVSPVNLQQTMSVLQSSSDPALDGMQLVVKALVDSQERVARERLAQEQMKNLTRAPMPSSPSVLTPQQTGLSPIVMAPGMFRNGNSFSSSSTASSYPYHTTSQPLGRSMPEQVLLQQQIDNRLLATGLKPIGGSTPLAAAQDPTLNKLWNSYWTNPM